MKHYEITLNPLKLVPKWHCFVLGVLILQCCSAFYRLLSACAVPGVSVRRLVLQGFRSSHTAVSGTWILPENTRANSWQVCMVVYI